MWNRRFTALPEFPFRRLAAMLATVSPPADRPACDLALGEPQHSPPPLLAATLAAHAGLWNKYPPPSGTPAFRRAATDWLTRRFALPEGWLEPDRHVLPVAGTKEALFLVAVAATDGASRHGRPAVLMPNPLYAVYAGAAALARAEPIFLSATPSNGFLPDLAAVPEADLARATVCYLCTPANPQGVVADRGYLRQAIELARRHDFLLVVDECYAEIYDEKAPPSALEVAAELGGSLDRLLVMHSLSKRSNAAGLRSGFIAGDPDFLAHFLRLRAYGGAVQPLPVLAAAAALWNDDAHAEANRALYRAKLDLADAALGGKAGYYRPPGGFFLWLDVGDGIAAAAELWRRHHLKVLPGAYLTAGEHIAADDPGARFIRVAMVHEPAAVAPALQQLVPFVA